MRVCVTGGLGFIGTRLVGSLTQAGHEVRVVDSSSGRRHPDGVEVHSADIRDADALDRILTGADVVVHLAALQSVLGCERDPQRARSVNVDGTRVLARGARRREVRRFIFTSTAAVYSPAGTPGVYGRSKLDAERVLVQECHGSELEPGILRLFNVYGPGQAARPRPLPAVAAAIQAARGGEPFAVRGSGEDVRDYIHVDDVVTTIAAEIARADRPALPLEVGTGVGTTLHQLLRDVEAVTGRAVTTMHEASEPSEIRSSVAAIGPTRERHPDFSPRSLRIGLTETIAEEDLARIRTGGMAMR